MTVEERNERIDVVVVGAGPAGSMAALTLRKAGVEVCVLERAQFPRFALGESLLPQCMDYLDRVGMVEALGARGYVRKPGATFLRGDSRAVISFEHASAASWGWTWQVERADFDTAMSDAAAAAGADLRFGWTVTGFEPGVRPRLTCDSALGQRVMEARFVIDATGPARVLPRLLDLCVPSTGPRRGSVFAHVEGDGLDGRDDGRIWIVSLERVWAWVIPLRGKTSVGFVGPQEEVAGDPATAFARLLASSPKLVERVGGRPFAMPPRSVSGFGSAVTRTFGPGYALVGNSAGFLDPIFSSGVTLAVASAHRAAELVVRNLAGDKVDWDGDYDAWLRRGVAVFGTFVDGWYAGTLPELIHADFRSPQMTSQITSILAGYVWDDANPFVVRPRQRLERKAAQAMRLKAQFQDP